MYLIKGSSNSFLGRLGYIFTLLILIGILHQNVASGSPLIKRDDIEPDDPNSDVDDPVGDSPVPLVDNYPDLDKCREKVSVAKDKSVFYSAVGKHEEKPQQFADQLPDGVLLREAFPSGFTDKDDKATGYKKFLDRASQAFAEKSSGVVHVLLPTNKDNIDKKVWTKTEKPALTSNKDVTRIVKVDPDDFSKKCVLWGDSDDNLASCDLENGPVPGKGSGSTAPTPQLTCNGVTNTKWMGRDALNSAIPTFCEDAEKQGVQDQNSGSLVRSYNTQGVDAVTLSMDWPSGADFKPKKDDCVGFMSTVMDSCDGNDPDHNPLNWKHGGYNQVGDVRYNIIPTAERYNAGVCSMHVHEEEYYSGVDGPGTERTHTFYLRVDAKDSADKTVATVDNDVEAGDANPYHLNGYYNELVMTPEAQGDYIQFALGDQYWRTTDTDGVPRCQVGGWDGDYSPVGRDMDCWFYC